MKGSAAKATVILACFNGGDTIAVQHDALSRQRWSESWELIVSDNGSTDNSRRIIEQFCDRIPNVRTVDSSDKRGAAHARNVAIKMATSDRFIFCDADDEIAPGWLKVMAEGLSKSKVVVSQFEDSKQNEQWVRDLWSTTSDGPTPCLGYLPCAAAYGFGFTREVYETVGEFDESLSRMSDIDFSWRVQQSGHKLEFLPQAVVHYRHRSTLAGIFRQAYGDGQAQVLLYTKYSAHGMPWRPRRVAVRSWLNLARRVPQTATKIARAKWLVDLGFMLGYIRGGVRHKVLAL
ncbi:MAG: hypothetical protein A2W18_15185 [Candidatus Muproteobacteria bacterium RBG_16_60_9]|uniref:Glycosyltransferase 2-like domain-containing protein n=1 Tax=Candidatus Muproteobacteria bacterium RBG_16_60_9 TaxID=1817755 RepID=A0A1F6UWB8_9PROT|nr:MAG: hypothetical protein A2W18_15185 [Candidatus Muproteobacteria bacterium RBG_16_60_9]